MLTRLLSFATLGVSAQTIDVEVGVIPTANLDGRFTIVGLGDAAVQESKQRVIMAIKSSNFTFRMGRTMNVNLAPAHVRKIGCRFDLPIAIGLMNSYGSVDLPEDSLKNTAFLGELAFDGSLRHVSGVLACAIECKRLGIERLMVPDVNAAEAALVPGLEVIPVKNLRQAVNILVGDEPIPAVSAPASGGDTIDDDIVDFADVRGQAQAKRALEIAAAGGHNVLLSGTPGSGKTLLANALRGILPPLSREEALEITGIYSVANLLPAGTPMMRERPIRMVHHTASGVAIVGGGQHPAPGEISLAHRGVLFLDEIAEFPPQVLEVLRQPLEDRKITINRAQGTVTFPADVILVAAMNPPKFAAASAASLKRRISAPLLDRIDLTIDVQPVEISDLQKAPDPNAETTATIKKRVLKARQIQEKRFAMHAISTNKEMNVRDIDALCPLDEKSKSLLKQAAERLNLSARSYHRVIKVARTIADLAESENIKLAHVAEALQYRQSVGV